MAKYDFSMTPGDYVYGETEHGKYAYGVVQYGATSERNSAAQRAAGGAARQQGDHGGHLIAHCLGGRNDASNLDAQNANVNQRGQRHIESQVAELAQDPNKTVFMSVENYSSNGQRPDVTMISVAVQDNTTGEITVDHFSLQNASYAEQAEWEAIANENSEIDPRQDDGMTAEQRALANELAEIDIPEGQLGEGYMVTFDDETPSNVDEQNAAVQQDDGVSLNDETAPEEETVLEDDGVSLNDESVTEESAVMDDGVSIGNDVGPNSGAGLETAGGLDDGVSLGGDAGLDAGGGLDDGVSLGDDSGMDDGAGMSDDGASLGSNGDDGMSGDDDGGMSGGDDGGMSNDD